MFNKITVIKTARNNECWIECGEKSTFVHFSEATMENNGDSLQIKNKTII